MDKKPSIRFVDSRSDNRKPVLSPSTPLRIDSVEGSKTCTEHRRSIENRKWVGCLAILLLLTGWVPMVEAQQPTKVSRIGYLTVTSPSAVAARMEAVRRGLRDL
jgi:hypothetical protein